MISKGHNECPGFVGDVRLTRRLKRRHIAEQNYKSNLRGNSRNKIAYNVIQMSDSDTDDDYAIFLDAGIRANRSVASASASASADEDEDEDDGDLDCLPADLEDPQYKLFLENLKEDGNSYVLEVAASGGLTFTIKYEKEVEECYGLDCQERETIDRNVVTMDNTWVNSEEENTVSPKISKKVADGDDPQYKLFFENLKEDGNSYVLEVAASGGVTYTIKYEKEVEEQYGLDHQEMETIDRNAATRDNAWVNPEGEKTVTPKISIKVADKEKRISEVRKSRRLKSGNPVYGVVNNLSSKKRSMKAPNLAEQESIPETDECYLRFLSTVRMEGEKLILTSNTGKEVIYEEGEESSSESDLIMMDTDPSQRQNNTPFIDLVSGSGAHNNSKFRAELMNLLQRPYSQKEYDDRWRTVSRRKGRDKSYLKHHSSLKGKIDSVKRDRCKVLNLLRGFLYWLEHVADEGSFPPWLDPSCLEVLPGKVDSSGSK